MLFDTHGNEVIVGAVVLTVVGTVLLVKNREAIVSILPKGRGCPEVIDVLTNPADQTCRNLMDMIPPAIARAAEYDIV